MSQEGPCGHAGTTRPLLRGRDRLVDVAGDFDVVRCTSCGLAYTMPPMTPEELAPHYPTEYPPFVETDARRSLRLRAGTQWDRVRAAIKNRWGTWRPIARRSPGRLLDVGCGRGDLAAWFAGRGWHAYGVEPSAEAATAARALGVDVHHGTLDDHPFEDGWFDAIVFNHSLEHVPRPLSDLGSARRLLRPSGVLTVAVPNFGSWQRRTFGSRWFHLDLPRHRQHFEARTLTELVRRAGLDPFRVRAATSLPGFAGSLLHARHGGGRIPPAWMMYAGYVVAAPIGRLGGGDVLLLHATRRAWPRVT